MAIGILSLAAFGSPLQAGDVKVDGLIESTSGGFQFPDGSIQTTARNAYAEAVIVAHSGGQFTSIQAALDSILDGATDKRYLVWVGPGDYNETVTMKPFVDIEGAGQLVTKITAMGAPALDTGTVVCADDAELRQLTVENTGGADYAVAIFCSAASSRVTHVIADASGATVSSHGVYNVSGAAPSIEWVTAKATSTNVSYGVHILASSPVLSHVEATASGGLTAAGVRIAGVAPAMPLMTHVVAVGKDATQSYGITNVSESPVLRFVTARGSGGTTAYGLSNVSGTPQVFRSVLEGSGATNNYGIYNSFGTILVEQSEVVGATSTISGDSSFTVNVALSLLDGGAADPSGGTINCAGVLDASYTLFPSTCPP